MVETFLEFVDGDRDLREFVSLGLFFRESKLEGERGFPGLPLLLSGFLTPLRNWYNWFMNLF